MNSRKVIALQAREANLKRKIRAHLKDLGFHKSAAGTLQPPALDKEAYRKIHGPQRAAKLKEHDEWIAKKWGELKRYFAAGNEVVPNAIAPRLELTIGGTWQSDLFRLAGLFWQIPISEGYGRRLRFLVWDKSNDKLIGLLALGDAVFNLKVRDELIGWDPKRRKQALVHLMDAYVLGALPPYSSLLGGKLIVSLLRTEDIVAAFNSKYRDAVGVISKARKRARLAAITTTSALGRSSIYNRVKLDGRLILKSIGFTSGWGHFHISDSLFKELKAYLKQVGDTYPTDFNYGNGPNWRLRLIKQALRLLGMDPDLVRHGFGREVFFCAVAENAVPFLSGAHRRIRYGKLPTVEEMSRLAIERWCIPRSQRDSTYKVWLVTDFLATLKGSPPMSESQRGEKRRGLGS